MKTKTATNEAPQAQTIQTGNAQAKATLERMIAPALHKISDLKTRREKLHYVADMIEAEALVAKSIGFNMAVYRSDSGDEENRLKSKNTCGTVACIAGWTMLLEKGTNYGKGANPYSSHGGFHKQARDLLELTAQEAGLLFTPDHAVEDFSQVTAERAVAVIRDLADKGSVRWEWFDDKGNLLKEPTELFDDFAYQEDWGDSDTVAED